MRTENVPWISQLAGQWSVQWNDGPEAKMEWSESESKVSEEMQGARVQIWNHIWSHVMETDDSSLTK